MTLFPTTRKRDDTSCNDEKNIETFSMIEKYKRTFSDNKKKKKTKNIRLCNDNFGNDRNW